MHLQNYILLLISRSTVLPINNVKDPYLAQDILQEVYILVLKNLDTLKNPASLCILVAPDHIPDLF